MSINLATITITEAHTALLAGEFSVLDLVNAYKEQIDSKNAELNIYREVFSDLEEQAAAAQSKIDDGSATLLTGIPIAIKDNILIEGRIAGASSKILEDYVATYDATVITKLREAGVVFLGRVNMDEFAMGGSTENSAYGVTKNPHDTMKVAGGSSGGSAAVVAADMALFALGSDTGGSIREPASFCGVVGMKPTYGSVSRHGLIAMGSSLDVIGPLTKNAEDARIVFDVIRGKDTFDSTSIEITAENEAQASNAGASKKIGVPRSFLKEGVDEDVMKAFDNSLEKLEQEGYEIVDIELPLIEKALAVYYILMPAEVSSNMARYDGVKYGGKVSGNDLQEDYLKTRGTLLGAEVKRRIILGTYILSAGYSDQYYNNAWKVRTMMQSTFENAFTEVDLIAIPTAPMTAFRIGEKSDPLSVYLADIFTVTANLTGNPAISVPMKKEGMPAGIQFTAPHQEDHKLFVIAQKFETM